MKVLITGGTGFLGVALTKRLLGDPRTEKVLILSRGEHAQAATAEAFGPDPRLGFILGDVRDPQRIHDALHRIDTVVVASALKRVDRVTHDPMEILKTNTLGTANVVRACLERGIGRVLMISSDKAAAPSTLYGCSKQAAEFIAVHANHFGMPRTRIAVARYGNVLGSTGSVVPVWRQQAAAGLPLTITDPRMSRFWWTVREAVDFVLLCLTAMRGGDTFIPKLHAMSISALADLVAPGHHRKTIGPRLGGEKRAEMLFSEDEAARVVEVANGPAPFFVLEPTYQTWKREPWKGRSLPAGQPYRSDTAPPLTADEMRAMLAEVEAP